MDSLSARLQVLAAISQFILMGQTLFWRLHCETDHRTTLHWYQGPAAHGGVRVVCAACGRERSLRLPSANGST